jgi:DNA/RNA-binding domain of Phe-tRNA-synthetase-like protein
MIDVALSVPIRVAVVHAENLAVNADKAAHAALEERAARFREEFPDASPGEIPGVQLARDLFRRLDLDPTRRRPSSESLLRRALQGRPMPHINTLVDAGNLCSLDVLLPLGLYDASSIRGTVTLRIGADGEGYEAIGDKRMNLAGRYLLADDLGAFGSPMTDSLRTAASLETTEALIIIYAPLESSPGVIEAAGASMADLLRRFCSPGEVQVSTLTGS